MKEPVVADSTCLIGLERVGQLDILPALFEPVMIPPEVAREFGGSFSWLQIKDLVSGSLVAALRLAVDAGEAEAIALASEKGCRLISDDKQARAAAKSLGLAVIGTIGVLVRAKQSGVLTTLKPVLDELEINNFYLSEELRREALRLANE